MNRDTAGAAVALVFGVLAVGCAVAPPAAKRPVQLAPSVESVVQLAQDYEALVAESALPPGLHRFELGSAQDVVAGGPGFIGWNGHPLFFNWADGRLLLHAVDESGIKLPVAFVDQTLDGLQTSIVPVPNGVPWVHHWTTQGPVRVGAVRIDNSESRTLLSLPASAGFLEDVMLSSRHQGVARVKPMIWQDYHWEPTGPSNLHLIGAAAGTVLDEPERDGLEHWGGRLLVADQRALAIYEFRTADSELVETVLLFIDLATGEAHEQTITDHRVEHWSYFDGERLITRDEPRMATRAGSPVLSTFTDPDPVATRVRNGSAVRCAGDAWTLEEATNPQTGVERVWLQSLLAPGEQHTLWEEQTRTPAQLAWQFGSVRRTSPLSCINGQLLTWGVLDPERDLVEEATLLVMVAGDAETI